MLYYRDCYKKTNMRLILLPLLFLMVSCNTTTKKQTPPKEIILSSDGYVETLPDMATFSIDIVCVDKDIFKAKECLVKKSNLITESLINQGIDSTDILTTSVNLNKQYEWSNRSRVFTGYASSTTVSVTVKKINTLDKIYTKFLEDENLTLRNLNYSHSQYDSLRNEAYIMALENSKSLANKLLKNLPETEFKIVGINNSSPSFSSYSTVDSFEEAEMRSDNNEDISISYGTVMVKANINVKYHIY